MRKQPSHRDERLFRVFGEVLPGSTTDDLPDHEDSSSDERERWLRDNRPPHHDGSAHDVSA